MILDTIFSLRRMERLSPTSYHLAKTECKSTPCGQTMKRVFGGAACSVAHQSLTQLDLDERWEAQQKTNQVYQLTGWMKSLLPRQCWSFLHVDVPDRADGSDGVYVANALTCTQTCVDCRIVKTKPHRRMWMSLFMEIAKRRMKVVTEKSACIPDTPLLCSSATVQA